MDLDRQTMHMGPTACSGTRFFACSNELRALSLGKQVLDGLAVVMMRVEVYIARYELMYTITIL